MRLDRQRGAWAVVAGLTVLAFGLRLPGLGESVAGDELFTLAIAKQPTLGDALARVRDTAITPPLHYVLVWTTAQVGDPRVWIKVPSLVAGTAAVPVVFLLGRRAVGGAAGLIAAALMALSPFAIFYSEEARVYATLIVLVALSSLLLLTALDRRRWQWWVAFSVVTCLILYAHYSGAFAIAAQGAWALVTQRGQRKPILLAHAGIVVGYLPWASGYLDQRASAGVDYLASVAPLTAHSYFAAIVGVFPAAQGFGPRDLPGFVPSVIVAIVLGGALVLLARRSGPPSRGWLRALGQPVGLLVVLLVATPIGALIYSLLGDSILLSRNLSSGLPAALVLIGALLSALDRPLALVATAALLAALAVGTVKSYGDRYRRTPWELVAEQVDAKASAGTPVVIPRSFSAKDAPSAPLDRGLTIWLKRKHPLYFSSDDESRVWTRAGQHGQVLVVGLELSDFFRGAAPYRGPGHRFKLVASRRWDALTPISLSTYRRQPESYFTRARLVRRRGVLTLESFLGRDRRIVPGAVDGFVDQVVPAGDKTSVSGWAADLEAGRPAEWVLAFKGEHLLAVGSPAVARPDLARLQLPLFLSGYRLETSDRAAGTTQGRARLRVVAVRGGHASVLMRSAP